MHMIEAIATFANKEGCAYTLHLLLRDGSKVVGVYVGHGDTWVHLEDPGEKRLPVFVAISEIKTAVVEWI